MLYYRIYFEHEPITSNYTKKITGKQNKKNKIKKVLCPTDRGHQTRDIGHRTKLIFFVFVIEYLIFAIVRCNKQSILNDAMIKHKKDFKKINYC